MVPAPVMAANVRIDAYNYDLPQELIAAQPLPHRSDSRLLIYKNGTIQDQLFSQLPNMLPRDPFIVFNDSRVIEARLYFRKPSGASIEIFCLQPYRPAEMSAALSERSTVQWSCLVGGAAKWKDGVPLEKTLSVGGDELCLQARMIQKEGDHYIVEFSWTGRKTFSEILEATGEIPLPPYIKRKREAWDAERYQTVFAKEKGSVAAPTAALHFTPQIIDELERKNIRSGYLSLHVGAGTFKPVKVATIDQHDMHAETFSVNSGLLQALVDSENIVAVGTTSLRSLESLYWIGIKVALRGGETVLHQWEAYELDGRAVTFKESLQGLLQYMKQQGLKVLNCRTSLLILPGYQFRSATALVTNFHQPRSTLLLLVAAFIGPDWKKVYDHALQHQYRFLSYGDSSLLWRKH